MPEWQWERVERDLVGPAEQPGPGGPQEDQRAGSAQSPAGLRGFRSKGRWICCGDLVASCTEVATQLPDPPFSFFKGSSLVSHHDKGLTRASLLGGQLHSQKGERVPASVIPWEFQPNLLSIYMFLPCTSHFWAPPWYAVPLAFVTESIWNALGRGLTFEGQGISTLVLSCSLFVLRTTAALFSRDRSGLLAI